MKYFIGILLYPLMRIMVKIIRVNETDEKDMIQTYMKSIKEGK